MDDSPLHLILKCRDWYSHRIRLDGDRALADLCDGLRSDEGRHGLGHLVGVLDSLRREDRYWSIWTGMWQPWQQAELILLAGLDGLPDRSLVRARKILIQINRMMTVMVSALFARRLEQQHIDRVTERRALTDDPRPIPTPRVHEMGSLRIEYDRISSLGKKKKVQQTAGDRAGFEEDPAETMERTEPTCDRELDQEWELGGYEESLRVGAAEHGAGEDADRDDTHTADSALEAARYGPPSHVIAVDTT